MNTPRNDIVSSYQRYIKKAEEKVLRESKKEKLETPLKQELDKALGKPKTKKPEKKIHHKHPLVILPEALVRDKKMHQEGLNRKRGNLHCSTCIHSINNKNNPCPYFEKAKKVCHNFTKRWRRR